MPEIIPLPSCRLATSRSGFTLIELMVALLLTGVVALIAHALFGQVMVGAEAIARNGAAERRDGEREWFLEACRGIEVGVPGTTGFIGRGDKASFTTRVISARGWVQREKAVIVVKSGAIDLAVGTIGARLADSVQDAAIDYLTAPEGSGGWVSGWDSPVSSPFALRIRWSRAGISDSLLCPIEDRG